MHLPWNLLIYRANWAIMRWLSDVALLLSLHWLFLLFRQQFIRRHIYAPTSCQHCHHTQLYQIRYSSWMAYACLCILIGSCHCYLITWWCLSPSLDPIPIDIFFCFILHFAPVVNIVGPLLSGKYNRPFFSFVRNCHHLSRQWGFSSQWSRRGQTRNVVLHYKLYLRYLLWAIQSQNGHID